MDQYKVQFWPAVLRLIFASLLVVVAVSAFVLLLKYAFVLFIPPFQAAISCVVVGCLLILLIWFCIINLADEIYACTVEIDFNDRGFLIFRPCLEPAQIDFAAVRHITVIRSRIGLKYHAIAMEYYLNGDPSRHGKKVILPMVALERGEEIATRLEYDHPQYPFRVGLKHI